MHTSHNSRVNLTLECDPAKPDDTGRVLRALRKQRALIMTVLVVFIVLSAINVSLFFHENPRHGESFSQAPSAPFLHTEPGLFSFLFFPSEKIKIKSCSN